MLSSKLILKMTEFDKGDPVRIQHFVKVFEFAHTIGVLEGLDSKRQKILDIAAILHDIAIVPCEKKFGRSDGKIQEQEGPAYAMELMKDFPEITEEEADRVCFLIAHHHTYEGIDDSDYRILLEADYLVNAFEGGLKKTAIVNARERFFETKTGIELLNQMFDL